MRNTVACLLIVLPLVSACGFTPVHGAATLSEIDSGKIQISQISGRTGHELRKALQQELATGLPGIPEGAVLEIDLADRLSRLALRPDGAAARSDLRLQADYTLIFEDERISGTVRAESSFNVPTESYGDISAQIAARERAAKLLAQRIATDLRLKTRSTDAG